MPTSTTFQVTTRHKLAKDEHGMTQLGSVQVSAATALNWILEEFPEDAWTVKYEDTAEPPWEVVTLVIDWSKVPDHLRNPTIPARRR